MNNTITYSQENIDTIKKFLTLTTTKNHYNNWNNRTKYGYHSFHIHNINIHGQRIPHIRLNHIKKKINFENLNLLDIGCNTGGMIFHLPELNSAIGIDFNKECIDSCNIISNILKYKTKHTFLEKDLNTFDIDTYLHNKKIDIIFLLSLGSWVKYWEKLYIVCMKNCKYIILETNNDIEGKPQLDLFAYHNCTIEKVSDSSDDDTTNNYGRKTYLITTNK